MVELSKTYNPEEHEQRLYAWWEGQGYFKPEAAVAMGLARRDGRVLASRCRPRRDGILHLGHAITASSRT